MASPGPWSRGAGSSPRGAGPSSRSAVFALGLLAILALHLSRGLRMARLVHGDERWTLMALQPDPGALIGAILQNDNHPPLYYLILQAWSGLIAPSISHGRLLSYLLALATLAILAIFHFRCQSLSLVAPLLLVGTNPLFGYYAATIRPYALLVALATAAILAALQLRAGATAGQSGGGQPQGMRLLFYGSCLALGLCHYYGTLLVVVLLAIDLIERRIDPSRRLNGVCLALLLIWPALQIANQAAQQQLSTNNWVRVVPIISTFNNFLLGTFPSLILARDPRLLFSLFLAAALLVSLPGRPSLAGSTTASVILRVQARSDPGRFRSSYLLLIIAIVLAVSALIDCITPFTTPYYFLICLPPVALLFDACCTRIQQRLGVVPAALVIGGTALCQLMLTGLRLAQA